MGSRRLAKAEVLSLDAEPVKCSATMLETRDHPHTACCQRARFMVGRQVYCERHAGEEALAILIGRANARALQGRTG